MCIRQPGLSTARMTSRVMLLAAVVALVPCIVVAQDLTGSIIGTVKDEQGGVLAGARVTISSPALIGGRAALLTSDRGHLRFPSLPPGSYALDIELQGFMPLHERDIRIGAGATIERTVVLKVTGPAESVVVEGMGSRIEARDPGFGTRFGPEDVGTIPTRRTSMFDFLRAAPGISATSPSSGTTTTISAFGSGANENQFLIDGTNTTCPCNGVPRSEPGVDFIQEVQVQSVGASAEFGNMQGAVVNVVTRQGSERFLGDVSYYGQTAGLTSQPVTLPYLGSAGQQSGYERATYHDVTTNVGGPAIRDRLWFFAGYQYARDEDSQPGTDPSYPRTYEMSKVLAKLTWRLAPDWQLVQSFHDEIGDTSASPTIVTPFEAITRTHISVPAMTFGNVTHTMSANTLWDLRVGRFVHARDDTPSVGDATVSSRFDRVTGVTSVGPPRIGSATIVRTTAKGTVTHYRPALLGADHQWKVGVQVERGEHDALNAIPTGVRYVDNAGAPFQSVSSDPARVGGAAVTASAFASDAITVGNRLTITAGVRFDHSRAISQDLHALDAQGNETDDVIAGRGTLYTWNIVSPRLGATLKLSADGRTVMRASYGRFSQGVLTGELEQFHPGATATTTMAYVPATGEYSRLVSVVDPGVNLQLDRETSAPRTDEYSVGVDRELGHRLAVAIAYVRKAGDNFIGWTDAAGEYVEGTLSLPDGRILPVFRLVSDPAARRFLLTNQDAYSLTYDGLVMAVEKRRSNGWQAFGSYTFSKTYGLQASSGTSAAGVQVSTVSPPNAIVFGRDPNDLTNATGRLANDRPHMFRVMSSVDVPRTGLVFAANLQHVSGKPWAAATQVVLQRQGERRILLESRGSRRLSSQTLLDYVSPGRSPWDVSDAST